MMQQSINRRTVLKSAAATVALPWLESLADTAKPPVRLGYVFLPNGLHMPDWTPSKTGKLVLFRSLKPFAGLEKHLSIYSGLAHNNARALGDGPGDHARSSAAFLTAAHPFKTGGQDVRCGISIDQLAASKVGTKTILPSLEIGCDAGRSVGICDSGYACTYIKNVSWRNADAPAPKVTNPAIAFERLFGSAPDLSRKEVARRRAENLSVLDYVKQDRQRLAATLPAADRDRLNEYFESLREVEKRLRDPRRPELPANVNASAFGLPPATFEEHFKLMSDLMVLAFQLDLTRVASFMPGRGGSNRNFSFIGVNEGHHYLSHHRGDKSMIEELKKIDLFHMEQCAYLVRRLASVREGRGTLLDNCSILFGSGIGDGNRHRHHDLPTFTAGGAGGKLPTGIHQSFAQDTPLANLFLNQLHAAGIPEKRFGDSTGMLHLRA